MSTTLLKLAADIELSLAAAVAVGATTATLASITDDDGNSLPSGKYGFTIDGETAQKEYIVCDLVGTALTGITSVSRQGTATSGFARYHRFGATVTITDWAILSRILNNLDGTTGFNSSVNLGYDGAPVGLTGNQFATVNYVLSVVSGGTVAFDTQVISSQTSGESLTANDVVYFKESDQKWWKADADTSATVSGVRLGIAGSTVGADTSLTIIISGPVTTSGLTAGSLYYISQTAGAITTTAPSSPAYPIYVGWALSTTKLLFLPQLNLGPSAGSLGVPSTLNTFLTGDNTTQGGTDQSQTTQNATQAVGEADSTGRANDVAQSFIPTKRKIRGVSLYKSANTGTFTGDVTVALQADSSGSPSGSDLATVTIANAVYNALATGEFTALFSSEYASLTPGTLYWIVITTSTADTANHPNLGTNSAGGYASGTTKYNNVTDGWVLIPTIDLYFKTLEGGKAQIVKTPSDSPYISPNLVPQLIVKNASSVSFVDGSSAAEVTLLSRLIPGGLIGTNNMIRGRLYFSAFAIQSSATFAIRLKYGGTTVVTATVATDGGAANMSDTSGYCDFELFANNSAAAQIGSVRFLMLRSTREADNDATVSMGKAYAANNGTATETSTNDLPLVITGQYSSSAAENDATVVYSYLEIIRQP